MMAEAKLNREYALRIAGVGAMMVGMCVWSLYDGRVGWPNKNRALETVRPALLATNLAAEVWMGRDEDAGPTRLEAAFQAKGHVVPAKLVKKLGEMKLPDKFANDTAAREAQTQRMRKLFEGPVYSAHDLKTQFVQAAVTLAFGVLAFASLGLKARRRYVADEAGLSGSGFGGTRLGYAELDRIDWSKWDEKGIVTLAFKSGQRYTLDGWHYAGVGGIVDEIRRQRPDLDAGGGAAASPA